VSREEEVPGVSEEEEEEAPIGIEEEEEPPPISPPRRWSWWREEEQCGSGWSFPPPAYVREEKQISHSSLDLTSS
jgi:hypothetical protein